MKDKKSKMKLALKKIAYECLCDCDCCSLDTEIAKAVLVGTVSPSQKYDIELACWHQSPSLLRIVFDDLQAENAGLRKKNKMLSDKLRKQVNYEDKDKRSKELDEAVAGARQLVRDHDEKCAEYEKQLVELRESRDCNEANYKAQMRNTMAFSEELDMSRESEAKWMHASCACDRENANLRSKLEDYKTRVSNVLVHIDACVDEPCKDHGNELSCMAWIVDELSVEK